MTLAQSEDGSLQAMMNANREKPTIAPVRIPTKIVASYSLGLQAAGSAHNVESSPLRDRHFHGP